MPLNAAEHPTAAFSWVLTLVTCPACGAEVDIWSAEEEIRCDVCDQRIFKKQNASH
jgi:DNA-directed RNA polymerase subunit RPC12/RpoP